MKNWNQLFIRHGWKLEAQMENEFNCNGETEGNMEFLLQSLKAVKAEFTYDCSTLVIKSHPVSEEEWICAVDFQHRGRGEGLWFRPGKEEPKVIELDTFISGIVRQVNRLGFQTTGSCDGHERRMANFSLKKENTNVEQLVQLFTGLGVKALFRDNRNNYLVKLPLSRAALLDVAEKLSFIEKSWLNEGSDFIEQQLFYLLLENLLSISGESGNEAEVREFVKAHLTPFVDYITIDRHGNLLAEKTYRTGHGPTILLNAHLDTVVPIDEDRAIEKNGATWTSSTGILGADDRAGVAVLLHMAEHLYYSDFHGKVKFIFTVKEECGLVGARKLDAYFLWGTDAAIVVDRRGNGDIVTSCGGYLPFCHEAYGTFFEKVAVQEGLNGWNCTAGGSSDTAIWASHGIQSVNLSVGYGNEHTEDEYVNVEHCYEVTNLLKGVFNSGRELRSALRNERRGQQPLRIVQ